MRSLSQKPLCYIVKGYLCHCFLYAKIKNFIIPNKLLLKNLSKINLI